MSMENANEDVEQSDPLDLLLGTWKGDGKMGAIDIEATALPGEGKGVPMMDFTDYFEFYRISGDPSTVAYRQNTFAKPGGHLENALIHSESGYFRRFADAPCEARNYELEQCRAVGRGIVTISQGDLEHDDREATLKFSMSSRTTSGIVANSQASKRGGLKQDGDTQERSPRGFGIGRDVTTRWLLKNGKLSYLMMMGIQNPAVVQSPDEPGKAPGMTSNRVVINLGMSKVTTPFPSKSSL